MIICCILGQININISKWNKSIIFIGELKQKLMMENKKGSSLFVVCLVLGIVAAVLLLFEGFRYLNDFPPSWYVESDYNMVKGGLAILIAGMSIFLTLIYFNKLRILASAGFFLVFLISLVTIYGLESNIQSNKNHIAALEEIGDKHVEELVDELNQKDEQIESLMESVNQLNKRLNSINTETRSISEVKSSPSGTNYNGVDKEGIKNMMESYCKVASQDLPYRSGDLIQKKFFFDGKDIIVLIEVTSDSFYRNLKEKQDKLRSKFKQVKDKGLNDIQIALMKEFGVGLRYRYTRNNQKIDIYFSPQEL